MVIIKDIMHNGVYTITKDTTIFQAAEIMNNKHVTCLVVVEGEEIEGIITQKDIIDKIVVNKLHGENDSVSKIMSPKVIVLNQNAEILNTAKLMSEHKIKQVPVVDGKKLVGIVTQTDFIMYMEIILDNT